jgi:regulatory protein SWI6
MQVARPSLSSSFPAPSTPQPAMYANPPHGNMAAPAFNRSFSDLSGFPQQQMEKPQIYTVRMHTHRRDRMLTY